MQTPCLQSKYRVTGMYTTQHSCFYSAAMNQPLCARQASTLGKHATNVQYPQLPKLTCSCVPVCLDRGQRGTQGIFLSHSPPQFLRQGFLESGIHQSRQTGWPAEGSIVFPLPVLGITGACCHTCLFTQDARNRTQVLRLMWEAPYQSHFPNPSQFT